MSTERPARSAPAGRAGRVAQDSGKLGREVVGLFAIFCGLLLTLSLVTFDARDPWLNHVVRGAPEVYNKAGLFGAYLSGLLLDAVGNAAWVWPAFFALVGARRILGAESMPWWRWAGFVLLSVCVAAAGASTDLSTGVTPLVAGAGNVSGHGGGLLGHMLLTAVEGRLGSVGAVLLWLFALLMSAQLIVGFSWLALIAGGAVALWQTCLNMARTIPDIRPEPKTQPPLEARPGPAAPAPRAKRAEPPAAPVLEVPAVEDFVLSPAKPASASGSELLSLDPAEELPPWVRDFEEDRLGAVPVSAPAPVEDAPAPAPAAPVREVPAEGADDETEDDSPESSGFPDALDAVDEAVEDETGAVPIFEPDTVAPAPEPKAPGLLDGALSLLKKPAHIPLPPLSLIEAIPPSAGTASRAELEAKGRSLMTCLADFGVQGELVGITPGPVVTMFEVRPAPGVRVSRIANLSDDLALALKAVAVRIQAPIPGTDTVGVEIPNEVRETVCLRELLGSKAFQDSRSLLTLILGKDIAGGPAVADLATMPHLLVAGATGAGKSVGINAIILSILYKARPDEVRMLLVDPKRVEMAIYSDLPHLVHPVVTEMQQAKNALEWAVAEMERRYTDIAKAGVRNIGDYNAKLKELGDERPDALADLEIMPYLVIIIDELADLMLVAAKEVETSIVRLAQLARAAGIHLILATQRPSVDVVTGLIKANFPCRVSYQVTSKHDSRTILDATGAEHLLGKGDMLFKPAGGKFRRMHGAYVGDKSVTAVCDYWRSRQKPDYRLDFSEWGADDAGDGPIGGGAGDVASDPLYAESVEFVRSQGKASISLIQRRFRIGFNKAARFIEQMERDGIVGPADGSKPRPVK